MKKLPISLAAITAMSFTVLSQVWTLPPPNPAPYVTLAWDAPDPALCPPSVIDHYKVYWGGTNSSYTNFVRATNLTCSITQFVRGATYFFAATTVATNGLESTNFSNEINWKAQDAPPHPNSTRVTGGK